MNYTEISHKLYRIDTANASFRLNLLPMNEAATDNNAVAVGFTVVRPDASLYAADLVGIVGMHRNACPPVPRICWDNREHQFWDGFQGSFETRNVLLCSPTIKKNNNETGIQADCYYIANSVKTSMTWKFYDSSSAPMWDTEITVENLSKETLKNYGQFFACYHKPSPNYYWDIDGTIRECFPESFSATSSIEEAERLKKTPYHDHHVKYLRGKECQYHQYSKPVLMSEKQSWYNDGRHIVFIEPDKCGAIATWMSQARDYYIRPPEYDLKPLESFKARIRHMITPCEKISDLMALWKEFEKAL